MKKILSTLFLLNFCLAVARADQAASAPVQTVTAPVVVQTPRPSRESVERLITALDLKQQLDAFYIQVDSLIGLQLSHSKNRVAPAADDEAAREVIHAKLIARIKAEVSWEKVEGAYIDAFSTNFTQEEVDGLVSFFESPIGKVYAARQSEIMQQSNHTIGAVIKPVMQEVMMEVHKAAGNGAGPGGSMPGGASMLMMKPPGGPPAP